MFERLLAGIKASYRQQQLVAFFALGAIFTLLGGFQAFYRFTNQILAEYYLQQGEATAETPEGQGRLLEATRVQPGWARAHLSLARAYFNDGWYVGAAAEGRKAFELAKSPTEKSMAIALVGFSHLSTGESDDALDALKLAVELDPANAKAQAALFQLEQKLSLQSAPNLSRPEFRD